MEKVGFILSNGRKVDLHPALANHLAKLKRGTYSTTALVQAPQRAVLVPQEAAPAPAVAVTDLASKTVEELRELAKLQGVHVHHRAGPEKIIEAIEKKAEE